MHDDALMVRCDRDHDKKVHSDLNYMSGHKTVHIDLPFIRSRKSKDVEIVVVDICDCVSAVSRTHPSQCVKNANYKSNYG